MKYIYVLELLNKRYYIGQSTNFDYRITQHANKRGSYWTAKWPIQKIVELRQQDTTFDEDLLTKKYMLQHGIHYVRGGSYCQIQLSGYQIHTLQREFDTSLGHCFHCGHPFKYGHKCNKVPELQWCYFCHAMGHRAVDCPLQQ
jgi:predicted GIY-YIG superfamily endonuclease